MLWLLPCTRLVGEMASFENLFIAHSDWDVFLVTRRAFRASHGGPGPALLKSSQMSNLDSNSVASQLAGPGISNLYGVIDKDK